MTRQQALLLQANGVRLSARVHPAPMENGWTVELRPAGSLEWVPLATKRHPREARVFRSLNVVWKRLALDLHIGFVVHAPGVLS